MPALHTHISRNSFLTLTNSSTTPSSSSSADIDSPTIVYFIPGNPGLIGYYHVFLSLLLSHLSTSPSVASSRDESVRTGIGSYAAKRRGASVNFDTPNKRGDKNGNVSFLICGKSMGGFQVADNNDDNLEKPQDISSNRGEEKQEKKKKKLYSLSEQIEFVERDLSERVRELSSSSPLSPQPEKQEGERAGVKVILIGHSVGSYIAMEILRRHREKRSRGKMQQGTEPGAAGHPGDIDMDIIGGILLFPTVVDIAKSPSGRKLTVSSWFFSSRFLHVE